MRFIKIFVFLALLGSSVWAQGTQPLTVLGDDPIDISSVAKGEPLQLGLQNNTSRPLTLTFSFEAQNNKLIEYPENIKQEGIAIPGGSTIYISLPLFPEVRNTKNGYLVINTAAAVKPANQTRVEVPFTSPVKFKPKWFLPIVAASFVIALLAWAIFGRNLGAEVRTGWIAGTPKVSFTESFGSLSTLLLAVSNAGLLPAVSALVEPGTRSLQVLGFFYALPIILAPVILRLGVRPLDGNEHYESPNGDEKATEKTPTWLFVIAAGISLSGTLLQTYLLYEWLKLLDLTFLGTFLNSGFEVIIPCSVGLLVALLAISSIRYAIHNLRLCTSVAPTPSPGIAGGIGRPAQKLTNTLF